MSQTRNSRLKTYDIILECNTQYEPSKKESLNVIFVIITSLCHKVYNVNEYSNKDLEKLKTLLTSPGSTSNK